MEDIKQTIFKDIYKVISEIKKCKSKSKYTILINELYTLYNLCDELGINDYPQIDNYSSKSIQYKYRKLEYAYKVLENYEYHIKFSKNYKNINNNKYLYPELFIIKHYFNSEEYFDIIEGFLKEYDPKLLDLLDYMLNEGTLFKINPTDKDEEDLYTPAYTTSSYGSYKPYIIIKKENCVADLISIVHELGHAKEYMNASNMSSKVLLQREYNCFEEVYSHYLQNLFIKYLEKINFYKDDVEVAKIGYNYTFYHWIRKLNDCLEQKSFDYNIVDYLNYTYGIAISYHFIDRYIKDPEKTRKEINDFIVFNGQYNFMEMLEKFNLKDEIINSKILKKYI